MALAVNDVYEVRLFSLHTDQMAVNTIHVVCTVNTTSTASQQLLADSFSSYFATAYKNAMSSEAVYKGAQVQQLVPQHLRPSTGSTGAGAGTVTGAALPRQTSGIITFYSNSPYRGNRGRIYIPFPSVTSNGIGGAPTTSYGTLLLAISQLLSSPFTVPNPGGGAAIGTFKLVLWKRSSKTYSDVVVINATTKWATQKRRGSFGRPNVLPAGL